ncbi:MAG: type III-B CRISPR module-associated protein Cmr5 [Saprospiraceae bacterium]|nr:type III-B CRISPR module-associated protein Cmr5 [Saprospiraceae bacterium]MCB9323930.1 type III-B CRISPR module-associated protein Cmr5 [Lewinellaceae bacterium]
MSELSLRKKVEQGRATEAFRRVKAFVKEKKDLDEYKSYSKKFPTMVKTSGLGASLAFILSKQKAAYNRILEDIIDWLRKDEKGIIELPTNDKKDFLEKVLELDSNTYRALTNEVLAFMNWHRRFTEGLIDKKKS